MLVRLPERGEPGSLPELIYTKEKFVSLMPKIYSKLIS